MATKVAEKAGYQEEVVVKAVPEGMVVPAAPAGSVRKAAISAAETYGTDVEKQAQAIGQAWLAKLNEQVKTYDKRLKQASEEIGIAATDLETPTGYTWWNLLLAGPFQAPTVGGPFLPSKVIRTGEPAFMLAVIRRNPNPIPGTLISASTLMMPLQYTLRIETVDLTNVVNGPTFGPIVSTFGVGIFGFLNLHIIPITFPAPPDGTPNLYEANMLVDITGPVPGMPFAGYNTWILDPDAEPAIGSATGFFVFSPSLGGLVFVPGLPAGGGGLQHDVPARFLVYTA